MMEKRIKEIDERLTEIDAIVANAQEVEEVRSAQAESKELVAEKSLIIEKLDTAKLINEGKLQARVISPIKEERTMEKQIMEKYEERGQLLKANKPVTFTAGELAELRAVSVGSGELILQKKYSNTLNDTFGQVSSTIDVVRAVPLVGGESYTKGFVKGYGIGGYTAETANYVETDPTFDYVTIGKSKITAYSEITDEALKLPNVQYAAWVAQNITISIRKLISRQILIGAGGANQFTGIINAPANVIDGTTDLDLDGIDGDTLDAIVYGYGGDEEVEGVATLFLSKADLAAFSAVRDAEGRKLYMIAPQGNGGTISSAGSFQVPYIINSALPALTASGTASGATTMIYGNPQNYEMPIFSNLTIEESRDFKFRTGQTAYRASIWAGGNTTAFNGFTRITKE
jgi:HK97 family phage major capsid protein